MFFLDDVTPKEEGVDVSTPEQWKKVMAELRERKREKANGG